jgi:protein-disulfide isomerase
MIHSPRGRLMAGLLAAGLTAAGALPAAAEEAPPPVDLPVEQIEQVVRDYLLREPEVIYQALEELQRRQQVAASERQKEAIAQAQDELLHDPASPVAGNPAGNVTLVEFFDYRCTYCRRVVPALQALLDDDSELRVVFKELPVLGEDSVRAARAALASRHQDAYLEFHFALMDASDLSQDGILAIARDVGLDPERLAQDMEAPEVQAAIEANYALASRLGIEGTPAFVIGENLIPGAVGKARLVELIEGERAG